MAEQKARRLIRKILREETHACVLATGCYAQLNRADLEALGKEGAAPGRLFVIPGDKKNALLDLPRYLRENACADGGGLPDAIRNWLRGVAIAATADSNTVEGAFRFVPDEFSVHSRGFLKIQDGCDRRCAYCRVSLARGKSVSLAPEEVLHRLRALEGRGCAEAVLTGVNICQYRGDAPGAGEKARGLGALVEYLLAGTSHIRLRLSSLEPEDIDEGLLASLGNPRLRPHFHLSIQSGSRKVLERMGRPYDPATVERAVSRLRQIKGDPFLACDMITGFPGESEDDFEETLELCRRVGFAWIHAFPYSPRPGTPAWNFTGQVPQREASARVEKLLALARSGRRDYVRRWIGKTVELVLEGKGADHGTSENYLKLLIPRPPDAPAAPNAGAWAAGERRAGERRAGSVLRCRVLGIPDRGEIPTECVPGGDFDAFGELLAYPGP
jgi:threonylcarbamoyladenosine tRNA methylthiotransferase MtaB